MRCAASDETRARLCIMRATLVWSVKPRMGSSAKLAASVAILLVARIGVAGLRLHFFVSLQIAQRLAK